ncbi:MAG: tetratricopeptide repeat protein [Gemmatimonadota bacterium]
MADPHDPAPAEGRAGDAPRANGPALTRRALIAAGLFLAAHLIVGWADVPLLWGLDMLRYLSPAAGAAFAAASAGLLLGTRRRPCRSVRSNGRLSGLDPWSSTVSAWALRVAFLVLGLGVCVAGRSAVHLLGDGYLLLRQLFRFTPRVGNEPLLTWLLHGAYDLFGGLDPEQLYRGVSYASGAAYLALCFPAAAALAVARPQRLLVLGLLATAGYWPLFCGYVETYPPLLPGTLLYLICGVHHLRGRAPLWSCAAVLALLVAAHFVLAALAPSLAFLAVFGRRGHGECGGREATSGSTWRPALRLGSVMIVGTAVWMAVLAGIGFGLKEYAAGLRGGLLLPAWGSRSFSQAYSLWQPRHWLDFANELVLVAPAALLTLAALGRRAVSVRTPEALFLAVAAAGPLLFSFVANTEIGYFRDWDVMALGALPLLLWAATVLCRALDGTAVTAAAGWLIVGAAALHTTAWVAVNADAGSAVGRYAELMETSALSGHARAYGWEVLGAFHRDAGRHDAALSSYRRALDANPGNWRYWVAVGEQSRAVGHLAEAVRAFEGAVERQPTASEVWDFLGTANRDLDRYPAAVEAHRRAVDLDPYDARLWYNLGNAEALSGAYAEAADSFGRALSLGDARPEVALNLGIVCEALGRDADAAAHYWDALEADPRQAMAHYRLARLRARLGETGEARRHAARFMELTPGDGERSAEMRALLGPDEPR